MLQDYSFLASSSSSDQWISDSYFKNRSRPCLQHQIRRYTAPCVKAISPEDYQQDVELAVMFLEGKSQAVLDTFKRKMDVASAELDFEKVSSTA